MVNTNPLCFVRTGITLPGHGSRARHRAARAAARGHRPPLDARARGADQRRGRACGAGGARRRPRARRRDRRDRRARLERGGRLVYVGAGTSGRLAAVGRRRVLSHLRPGRGPRRRARRSPTRRPRTTTRRAPRPPLARTSASPTPSSHSPRAARRRTSSARCARPRRRRADSRASPCAEAPSSDGVADHEVVAVTGPEVIAGSTRMKAGTAQKLVLNTISTVSMVRLGRTYGNLMVDVVASEREAARACAARRRARDRRLRRRRRRGARRPRGGDAKVAIVSLLTRARRRTTRVDGSRPRTASSARALEERMRLGVEAAVVDGVLLRGDVEIADGKIAAVGLAGGRQRDRDPGPRRPAGERLRRRRLRERGRRRLPASGEALLECGVTAFQPTLTTAPEDELVAALARDPPRAGRPAHHRRAPRRPVPLARPARRTSGSRRAAIRIPGCSSACSPRARSPR